MYPWTGYADFTPTSCSWAQELYLQQRRVSRSKTRGDLKFIREDDAGFLKALIQTSVWPREEGSRHKYLTSWMKRRAGPQSFLSSAVPWQFCIGEPAGSFNASLYSASLDAAMSNCCIQGGLFCYRSPGQPVTGQGSLQEGFHPDLKQTVFFHSVVKIS